MEQPLEGHHVLPRRRGGHHEAHYVVRVQRERPVRYSVHLGGFIPHGIRGGGERDLMVSRAVVEVGDTVQNVGRRIARSARPVPEPQAQVIDHFADVVRIDPVADTVRGRLRLDEPAGAGQNQRKAQEGVQRNALVRHNGQLLSQRPGVQRAWDLPSVDLLLKNAHTVAAPSPQRLVSLLYRAPDGGGYVLPLGRAQARPPASGSTLSRAEPGLECPSRRLRAASARETGRWR